MSCQSGYSSRHHYRCYLPVKKGVSGLVLRLLFSGIRVGPEQKAVLERIPEDAVLVYVTQYKSDFEFLFFHTRYAGEGLPAPEIGLDYKFFFLQPLGRILRISRANLRHLFRHFRMQDPYESGYIRQELLGGRAGFLSLVEERGFYRRFVKKNPDPLRYLIDMQGTMARPVILLPQLICYSKAPDRATPTLADMIFGSRRKPGSLRRIFALVKKPESVFMEVSEPVNIQEFLRGREGGEPDADRAAMELRQFLLDRLNRHQQSILGPVLKSHEEIKESILTNPRILEAMSKYADGRNLPLHKVNREADGYLDEIAARFNINVIRCMSVIVRWLTNTMFEGISLNTGAMNEIKSMSRRGPLVLVPCHKSHIDYLVLSYVMFHNDMPCPYIAAGRNLSFWPLGPMFRGAGAFFIRRTFRGAVLYSRVFAEYIRKLMSEGFNIEFFIEGGRSRTGKLLQPKLGLLSILLTAFREGAGDDLIFVPVFVGYDRVPEEGAYLRELEGGKKRPESLTGVLRARKLLKKRYGRIYIRFSEGISIQDLFREEGKKPLAEMNTKEFHAFVREMGHRLLCAIDAATVITPHAVTAAAILNSGSRRIRRDRLMESVDTYMRYLSNFPVQLADTLAVNPDAAFDYVLKTYERRRFIESDAAPGDAECSADSGAAEYTISSSRRPALGYYMNNCIKVFVPAAFTAMAILELKTFRFYQDDLPGGYARLKEFFRFEFSYDVDTSPSYFIQKNLDAFMADGILTPDPDQPDVCQVTASGLRRLKLFASFLESFFESYLITLTFLGRYPRNFVDARDRLKKVQSMGNRMLSKGDIRYPEAVSRINFRNGLDYFQSQGIRGREDEDAIRRETARIRLWLEHLRA